MIIIADYYIYHIGEVSSNKNVAELNLYNGLLKVHSRFHSENSKPELVVDLFGDSICIQLENNKFELSDDGSYYTTFLIQKDKELVEEIYYKHQSLFA